MEFKKTKIITISDLNKFILTLDMDDGLVVDYKIIIGIWCFDSKQNECHGIGIHNYNYKYLNWKKNFEISFKGPMIFPYLCTDQVLGYNLKYSQLR